MSSDELTQVQEELAATQAEFEQLQVAAADREARSAQLEGQLSELREELAQARGLAQAREQELGEQARALEGQIQSAAQRYRELALQQAPELPAELVAGDTVQEVDAALQQARETVSKVRGHLESQAQADRVPVGAPPRSGPDFSAMSTGEKIRYGLEQRSE